MRALLRVTTGRRANEEVTVQTGEVLSVGRSSESDLQLLDLGVSRFHCVVEGQADGLSVTDLNSSNSTLVNGQPIKRQVLAEGDEIGIGPVTLLVKEIADVGRPVAGDLFAETAQTESRLVRSADPAATALLRPVPEEPGEPDDQAALSLTSVANAVSATRGHRVARDLAALYRIGNAIHAEESTERLLATVLDTVLGVVHAERAFLVLVDAPTGELRPALSRAPSGAPSGDALPMSRPIVRECVERGVAVLSPDLTAEERPREGAEPAAGPVRSVLCVPLSVGAEVLGAVYVDAAADPAPFGEDDLELLTAIARQAGLALHRTQLIDGLERLFLGAIETLVATVEAKDIYTYGHSARVSKRARLTAERLGRPHEEVEQIKIAGLLHDIGKIGIPESILRKPDRLTEEEWAYVRSHPQIGETIIRQMGSERLTEVERLVRHHHERLDGKGYPDGLAGDAIPFGARVLAVADSYDAMTSNRPYRTPFSSDDAAAELRRCVGQQFQADIVEAFLQARAERFADVSGGAATIAIPKP